MPYGREDFEWIVPKYQSMVYSIALHFFHNVDAAQEVTQDVFIRLYKHIRSIESETHLILWLRRTSIHRCIDTVRRQNPAEIPMDIVPEVTYEPIQTDPLRDEALRRLVSVLPEPQRVAIVLRYGEDMDPLEIAEVMSIPVATVRSHLRRAIAVLREKIVNRLGKANHGSL